MSYWEDSVGKSDEWYTPSYIFDAMDCLFDLDPAHPHGHVTNVPCKRNLTNGGLEAEWEGFVWLNPPFGARNGLVPWVYKFFAHGNGVMLTPDRTSAKWWQEAANMADAILFIDGKVKFQKPDGSLGRNPSSGTTLFASGELGVVALERANTNGLGFLSLNRELAIDLWEDMKRSKLGGPDAA